MLALGMCNKMILGELLYLTGNFCCCQKQFMPQTFSHSKTELCIQYVLISDLNSQK